MSTNTYGMQIKLDAPHGPTMARVREELAVEGFGVITEIDVRATFRQKLDLEFRPYVILGACNPRLAHGALSTELEIGLLLPCNVIVYEDDDGGTVVSALDPERQLQLSANPTLAPVAADVRSRMERVLERLVT
ncbi:MAG TPA: DUF302 domain-containing protein [Gemmatimonadales bacterium]